MGSGAKDDDEGVSGVDPVAGRRTHRQPINAGPNRPEGDRDLAAAGLGNGYRLSRMHAASMGSARRAYADHPKTDTSGLADAVANRHLIPPPSDVRRVNRRSAGARNRIGLGTQCEREG
jgi:hypothetical protein